MTSNDVELTSLRRIDVSAMSCACWEFGLLLAPPPPPNFLNLAPPPPTNILNLPTPMEGIESQSKFSGTKKLLSDISSFG